MTATTWSLPPTRTGGADFYEYKAYLESEYHDDFDRWASTYKDAWGEIDVANEDLRMGVASYASDVSWNSPKRLGQLEDQGIVAEVLFPNTTPPFFPSGSLSAPAPADPPRDRREYELRFAGIRAHNRWVADFCRETPGRRRAMAQVFLSDLDDTVTEIRRAHADGLAGVLLPPDHFHSLQSLYYPRYDQIWALCEELDMPVGRHGVVVGEASSSETGFASSAIGMLECVYFCQRSLLSMIVSGVFERFPLLKFVVTELGASWVPTMLATMDGFRDEALQPGTPSAMFGADAARKLTLKPSEYFARNCYVGSFFGASDRDLFYQLGVDRFMWGADYPHHEGTSPYSRLAMRLNFCGLPEEDVAKMLAGNAADVYGFDLDLLQPLADKYGPTVAEIDTPVEESEFPTYPSETVCSTFVRDSVLGQIVEAATT